MLWSLIGRGLLEQVLSRAVTARPEDYAALVRSLRRLLARLALIPAAGGLGVGLALGVGVGLMVAPSSGRELRRSLRLRVEQQMARLRSKREA